MDGSVIKNPHSEFLIALPAFLGDHMLASNLAKLCVCSLLSSRNLVDDISTSLSKILFNAED